MSNPSSFSSINPFSSPIEKASFYSEDSEKNYPIPPNIYTLNASSSDHQSEDAIQEIVEKISSIMKVSPPSSERGSPQELQDTPMKLDNLFLKPTSPICMKDGMKAPPPSPTIMNNHPIKTRPLFPLRAWFSKDYPFRIKKTKADISSAEHFRSKIIHQKSMAFSKEKTFSQLWKRFFEKRNSEKSEDTKEKHLFSFSKKLSSPKEPFESMDF